MSRALALVALLLIALVASLTAQAQDQTPSDAERPHMSDRNLIVLHQRCVLQAFARDVADAHAFDPHLLDKAVAACEFLLDPLKKAVMARTHDPAFAETALDKIRKTSRRGVAVAIAGSFATDASRK